MRFYKNSKYKAFISQQGLFLVGLAMMISLFCAYLAHTDKTQSLDWLYYDYTQELSDLPIADDLVVIEIDDKSIGQLGRWPWPRRVHAQLIDKLRTVETKALIFDILFPDLDTNNPDSDQHFAQAINASGKVLLPIYFEALGAQGQVIEIPPHPLFYSGVQSLGHVHIEAEIDGIVRSVYLKKGVGTAFWPHLSLALFEASKSDKSKIPGSRSNGLIQTIPSKRIEKDFKNLLPMPSSKQGLRHYSYSDILDGSVDLSRLQGKFIYIGATATGLGDALATPLGIMSGVELNAWIFQALRYDLLIQSYPKYKLSFMTFVFVLLFVLVLGRLSPRLFLMSSLFGILGILLFSSVLLLFGRVWLPPASAVIGLVLFFPLWSWLRAEYILRFLRAEIDALSLATKNTHSNKNSQQLGQQFLTQIGMLDFETNQLTPKGKLAIEALYTKHSSKLTSDGKVHEYRGRDTYDFWQQQLEKHKFSLHSESNRVEGVELIARMISQFSIIKQNDQKNRKLIEKSLSRLQDAVCITDLCGEIIFINKRFEQWFHSNSETAVDGSSLLNVLSNIDLKSGLSWTQVLSSLYQNGKLYSGEGSWRKSSDQHLLCQASLVSINEAHHDTLILTFTDITQLKVAENARAEALSFLSHDLRSPMVSVLAILDNYRLDQANTDLLNTEPPANKRHLASESIQSIETLVRKNLDYAESFLQLSRADALLDIDMSPCDFHAVLDGAQVYAHALALPKSINVVIERCNDDAWVLGDISLLERALNNLISNAIKFSPTTSTLTLALSKHALSQSTTEIRLCVKDQGVGIDKADQADLFNRFTRIKRTESNHGAGLGLNFVATVVKKHQGTITLTSELDIGSNFTIHLPAISEADLLNY